ncbi:MAG: zinc ribbon domain-containing protein [Chloroflexota bacterium]|jgi:RNA polymerase subunit RPABC4/transcription elongation factor Spt4
MTLPTLDTLVAYATVCFAIFGALLAAVWLSLIIWTFRDMRSRSRDPFAQILAALVVALLPGVGLLVYFILRPRETLASAYERALEEEALLQEIEERPACPGCSRTVDPHWMICPHCHTRLRKACPDCNALMDLHWKVCPYCGNNRFDPYQVGPPLILAEDVVAAREAPDSDDADEALIQERLDFIEAEDEIEDSELEPPQVQD